MKRRVIFTILVMQTIGAIGWLTNATAPDPLGKPLWIMGFAALLPGNLVAPAVIEEMLWSSSASLTVISVLSLAGSIMVNLTLAAIIALAIRVRRRRQSPHVPVTPRRDAIGSCERCRGSFDYMIVHNGFNDTAYAYCDRCGMTTFVGGYSDPRKPPDAPLRLHDCILVETEPWLAPCECGGRFRREAAPRCPSCNEPLSAQSAATYIERNAPGTAKGWWWQRSWIGMYCIVVNGRMTKNNWRPEREVV